MPSIDRQMLIPLLVLLRALPLVVVLVQMTGQPGTVSVDATASKKVRLVGGGHPQEGRVELWTGEEWGTVCDTHWDVRDAMVVCRELGFNTSQTAITVWEEAHFGKGGGPIMGLFDCYGNERRVSDCYNKGWGNSYCQHKSDAGVTCAGSSFNVRLVNGSRRGEGRVEVEVEGVWGPVCDDGWGWRAARVVCRQLGFHSEEGMAVPLGGAWFGEGDGPVMMEDVECEGDESSLLDCPFPGWQLPPSHSPLVKLSLWNWGAKAQAWSDAHFGAGSGPILMGRVLCKGYEAKLLDCFSLDDTFFPWDRFCTHYSDAGVTCA